MNILQAIVYGVVQGITEFLPVSSTAHLMLIPWLFGWKNPGDTFDVALHFGTALAVIAYFFGIVSALSQPGSGSRKRRTENCSGTWLLQQFRALWRASLWISIWFTFPIRF